MTRERLFGWVSSVALQVFALGALGVSPLWRYDDLPTPHNAVPLRAYVRVIETPKAPVERRAAARGRSKPDVSRVFTDFVAPVAIPDEIAEDPGFSGESTEGDPLGVPFGIPGSPTEAPPVAIRRPPPPDPLRVGGSVVAPRKRHNVNPTYPPVAAAARVQGTVILEATIDEDGNVVNLSVLRSVPLLDGAALEAVRQWKYEPTLLNGSPVPILMSVSVRFELGR